MKYSLKLSYKFFSYSLSMLLWYQEMDKQITLITHKYYIEFWNWDMKGRSWRKNN